MTDGMMQGTKILKRKKKDTWKDIQFDRRKKRKRKDKK